jgi:hypothetical protein
MVGLEAFRRPAPEKKATMEAIVYLALLSPRVAAVAVDITLKDRPKMADLEVALAQLAL